MKWTRFAVPALLLATLLRPQPAAAQDPDEEVAALLSRLTHLVAAMHREGLTIVHISVDKLEKGQTYSISRTLYSDNYYKVYGIGGKGIKDLDLEMVDSDGDVVARDNSSDNIPMVKRFVPWTRPYTIKAQAYALEPGANLDEEFFFVWVLGFKRE